ncbi:MAG: transcriptional repressor LexA [Candidatus Omnitrophica bacterium]|nr:transcriptional repressor LexA [Candidatus Omnitrophota bacterium]
MKKELTEKQRKVLQFIAQRVSRENRPPTIREIAQNFKFSSTGTVRDYLRLLQAKGYLKLQAKKARAIELISEKLPRIPILAQVQAGSPVLSYEAIEDYLDLKQLACREDEQIFALRVKGDSMIEAGIMPEDLVLIRPQLICENGDIIVALIDGETTIKYFRRQQRKAYLQPANNKYAPILIKDNFSIIGKVISVIRKYV